MAIRQRIGLRQVRALKPGETVWDASLSGFGARRQKSDAVSYVLYYRTNEGRQRWYTIGRHGAPWTPDTAREEAKRLLGDVAHKADPAADKRAARNAQTVSELCDLYLADAEAGRLVTRRRSLKKASTLATDRGRIERHIKPLIGRRAVASVTRGDVEAFMFDVASGKTAGKTKTRTHGLARVRGGRGTATRTVGLLGAIFTYAVAPIIRFMALYDRLTADATVASQMTSTRRLATRYARLRKQTSGRRRFPPPEQLAIDVLRAANPSGCHVDPARLGLGVCNKLGDGRDRKLPAHHHDARCERNARDRDNIADEIEIELFIERCIDDCGRDDEEERVSVGRRAYGHFGTDIGTRARTVLDHERLVEPLREPLAHQAHDDVACSPGCDRGYNAHRARRIGLRTRDARQIRQCSSTRGQFQKYAAGNSYGGFLAERDEDAL